MTDTVVFRANSQELTQCLDALAADLCNAPLEVRHLALDVLDPFPELIRIETHPAPGAAVTLLFKPSQRLLDLRTAIRTGDFDRLVVKQSHGEASR